MKLSARGSTILVVFCLACRTTTGEEPPADAAVSGMDASTGMDAGTTDAAGIADAGQDAGAVFRPDAGRRDAGSFDAGPRTPHPRFAALPDNTAVDLGVYTCAANPGENAYGCTGIMDYSGFAYDPHRHAIFMFGGGHATVFRDDVDILDLTTLTWAPAYTPTPCNQMNATYYDPEMGRWTGTNNPFSRHTYDMLAIPRYATPSDFYLLGGTNGRGGCVDGALTNASGSDPFYVSVNIAHFNREATQWTFTNQEALDPLAASEFDPVGGTFVVVSNGGIWLVDPRANAVTQPANFGFGPDRGMGYANHLVYFPANDRFYYFARGATVGVFEVTVNRADVTLSDAAPVADITGDIHGSAETGYDHDARNQVIAGDVKDGVIRVYDPLIKTWTSRTMLTDPPGQTIGSMPDTWHGIVYIPLDNVFIFLARGPSGVHTWAYRYAN